MLGSPPTPELFVSDAPFTRSRTVDIVVNQPSLDGVDRYLVSNTLAVDASGNLLGTTFIGAGPWTLADGADGARTIFAQIHYLSGEWSSIIRKDLRLDTTGRSALYVDLDPQSTSTVIRLSGGHKWHEISRTPAEPFYAASSSPGDVTVWNSFWYVYFRNVSGPMELGPHELGPFNDSGECVGYCANVTTTTRTHCAGTKSGSFTVNRLELTPEGDIRVADIDFRIICRIDMVMAGSVRYGTNQSVAALDQSTDQFQFGEASVGATTAEQSVTITNIGDTAAPLGQATIKAWSDTPAPADYQIANDTCSLRTLAVNTSCALGVTFTPGAIDARRAILELSDATARGSREVLLTGFGRQPTNLTLTADGPRTAPGPITFRMTITPPTGEYHPDFELLNGPPGYTLEWTVRELSSPARREYSTTVDLAPGTYTASARFLGGYGYLASSAGPITVTMTGDSVPPVGEIQVFNVHSGYTNSDNLETRLPATDNDSGVAEIGLLNPAWGDMNSWIYVPYDDEHIRTYWWLQPDVPTHLYVKWRDVAGNWSEPKHEVLTLDTTSPSVTAPSQEFVAGSSVTAGKVIVRVPWTSTDAVSGVADHDLNQRTDVGSWIDVPLTTPPSSTTQSVNLAVAPQLAYTFRARATDIATNVSPWAEGQRVAISALQDKNGRIHYQGSWKRVRNSGYWGRTAMKSTKPGSVATMTFTGRSIAWVSRTGPDHGRAFVYVDDVLVQTVDLYGTTVGKRRVVAALSWPTSVARTIKIVVASTAGRSVVEIDALVTGT